MKLKLPPSVIVMFAMFTLLLGCTANSENQAKTELIVSAAASMTDVLTRLGQAYEEDHENIEIKYNFGSSGALAQQIKQGAPVDVFISAAEEQMEQLINGDLVDRNQTKDLVGNRLVLIVPSSSPASVDSPKDLTSSQVKNIAVGQPSYVPAGFYAYQALTSLQLWDRIQGKIVFAKDVRQVLTYVESGNAEAGMVYQTDALSSEKVRIAAEIDPAAHSPIVYPVGIVKSAKYPLEAKQFYDYLGSADAIEMFEEYGFSSVR